jgi:hypothetical protein
MVAAVVEYRDVVTSEDIPVEVRARIEANVLFDALQAGDYAGAAHAQERLRSLGWCVSRDAGQKARAIRRRARPLEGGVA